MDLLAFAKNIADRVEAQSARAKVPVAVCVIDIHGNIILKHRMSGAPTRPLPARAAGAGALLSDGPVRGTVLFNGRRSAAHQRGPIGRGRRRERWHR